MIKGSFYDLLRDEDTYGAFDSDILDFSKNVLIPHRNMIPPLYRYSKADYYNIRALETQTLFLSPIGDMNDVFEGLSCEINDRAIDWLESYKDFAFIKSFSEVHNHLLMWAHYADSYAGMCVEYDFSQLENAVLYHLFPVYYSDVRTSSKYLDHAIKEHRDLKEMIQTGYCLNDTDFLKDIFSVALRKSTMWEYEKEWRILATYAQIFTSADDMGSEELKELFMINSQTIDVTSCIKSVYLGVKMKQEIKNHILEICRTKLNGISVYSTKLSKNSYSLEIRREN